MSTKYGISDPPIVHAARKSITRACSLRKATPIATDITFDESVPFYRLFLYRSAPLPPLPLFLAPGPPPVDPLPPQGPAPSGVSQLDPPPGAVPGEVAVDSGAARGTASGGAEPGGAEPGGAEPGGAETGGAEPVGAETGGAEPRGAETGGAEPKGLEPGGAESEGAESGGAEPQGTASSGGSAGASPRLSPQQLREWLVRRARLRSGASGGGAAGAGGAGVPAGAGVTGGTTATSPGGARTGGIGAAGTGGVGGAGAGDPTESGAAGAGGSGAGGAEAGGARVGGTGVGCAGTGGAGAGGAGAVDPGGAPASPLPAPSVRGPLSEGLGFESLCAHFGHPSAGGCQRSTGDPRLILGKGYRLVVLGGYGRTDPLLNKPYYPSGLVTGILTPSPYTEHSDSLTELCEPVSRPVSPVRTAHHVPRSRPPHVPGTHAMALRPSFVPLHVPLPAPPESSLPEVPDPESDRACATSPAVSRLLATVVTDPSFESAAASALVVQLLDFVAACRLDYTTALVAESQSASPPSVGGECALGTDVLEDRQEDFECLAAAVPCFASMLLAPEGDPDAPDIPTPRSYTEAITGPYSSQWQAAMYAEMASWKSTCTYVDEVPPPVANIVDGMWIFRVKQPPGSPPAFKARYVARGFNQRQGIDYF
ncbi:unnamed protein product [Closterium sp. NIES-54]